jgi:exopolysaccharide biosynthesis polyprenyl glycosylphosphotransferase
VSDPSLPADAPPGMLSETGTSLGLPSETDTPPGLPPGTVTASVLHSETLTTAALAAVTREGRRRSLALLLVSADAASVTLAAAVAAAAAGATDRTVGAATGGYVLLVIALWFALASLHGFYRRVERRPDAAITGDLAPVFEVAAVAAFGALAPFAAFGDEHVPLFAAFAFWLLAAPLVTLSRLLARRTWARDESRAQRTLIVGAGQVGELLARKITAHPETGLRLVGFVDSNPRTPSHTTNGDRPEQRILGAAGDLERLVDEHDIDRVIIAFSLESHELQLRLVRDLVEKGVEVDLVPRLFEVIGPSVKVGAIEGLPLFSVPALRLSRSSRALKRGFDVVASSIMILLTLPVLTLIALCVKLDSPGPVLFRQKRIGANGKPFTIYKFRSMNVAADALKSEVAHLNLYAFRGDPRMFKVENDPRVTRFGRYIRRYFVDELPQLLNVLRGDMSLVGPRPLIPEEDRHVVDWQRSRLALKPGITGPWQVLGGNDIPFDEMVKLDYLYVTGWTLATDVQLLLQTCSAVVRRRSHL